MYGIIFYTRGLSAVPVLDEDELGQRFAMFETIEETYRIAESHILYGKEYLMIIDFKNGEIVS